MSNLQSNCRLEQMFQKVYQFTGHTWLVQGTKPYKNSQGPGAPNISFLLGM